MTVIAFELAALPLVHSAWVTALVGSAAHAWVLRERLAIEEAVLLRHADYRATMAHRPRFIPRLGFRRSDPDVATPTSGD